MFYVLQTVQISSRALPASYLMGTEVLSPGIKRRGPETDRSPVSSSEVKNAWSYISSPPYA